MVRDEVGDLGDEPEDLYSSAGQSDPMIKDHEFWRSDSSPLDVVLWFPTVHTIVKLVGVLDARLSNEQITSATLAQMQMALNVYERLKEEDRPFEEAVRAVLLTWLEKVIPAVLRKTMDDGPALKAFLHASIKPDDRVLLLYGSLKKSADLCYSQLSDPQLARFLGMTEENLRKRRQRTRERLEALYEEFRREKGDELW